MIGALIALRSMAAHADGDQALMLLRYGVALRRAHRDTDALEVFARALSISASPVARAQVALAEQALGRWTDAEVDLDLAMRAEGDQWIAKNRAALDAARDVVEQHLAWRTVVVDPPSAEVRADGRAVGVGTRFRVASEPLTIEVSAAGYRTSVRSYDVKAGSDERIAITLEPIGLARSLPSAASRQTDTPIAHGGGSTRATARSELGPVVLGAVGCAGVLVGTYFGVRTFVEKSSRDAACSGGSCSAAAMGDDTAARTSATVANISIGAGLLSAAGAFTWWLVERKAASSSASAWRVTPVASVRSGGLLLSRDLE